MPVTEVFDHEVAGLLDRLVGLSREDPFDPFLDLVWPQQLEPVGLWMSPELLSVYGTPQMDTLIRRMSSANLGWGALRIDGELGKLGIKVSETSVANYIVRPRNPPSQTWRTQGGQSVRFPRVNTVRIVKRAGRIVYSITMGRLGYPLAESGRSGKTRR